MRVNLSFIIIPIKFELERCPSRKTFSWQELPNNRKDLETWLTFSSQSSKRRVPTYPPMSATFFLSLSRTSCLNSVQPSGLLPRSSKTPSTLSSPVLWESTRQESKKNYIKTVMKLSAPLGRTFYPRPATPRLRLSSLK